MPFITQIINELVTAKDNEKNDWTSEVNVTYLIIRPVVAGFS